MPDDETVRSEEPDDLEQPDEADEPDEADKAAPDEAAEEKASSPAGPSRLRLVQAAVVLVALGLFVWSLVGYLGATSDDGDLAADSRVRDEVQVEASNAVEVLNTLDARDIDAGLDAWASVSTGDLRDELTDLTDQQQAALSKVARISEGTVVSSAVTRLDADAGTASVICFVEKQVGDTPVEVAQAAPSRIQFTVDLREDAGTWLVTKLTPVAVVTPEGEEGR